MPISGSIAAWNASLNHAEIERASDAAFLVSLGASPEIAAVISAAVGYVQAIDAVGGNNGVNITGVGGNIIVTPPGIPIISDAIILITGVINGAFNVVAGIINTVVGGLIHAPIIGGAPRSSFMQARVA